MLRPEYLQNIPYYMHDQLRAYVMNGVPPSSFLMAVLCNDLKEAVAHADASNILALKDWASLMVNDVPADCQGSREKVVMWLIEGGHNGRNPK